MYVTELNHCCSIMEIGNFDGTFTRQDIINSIIDNIGNGWDQLHLDDLQEIPQVYVATTTPVQTNAARLLKEMGFTSKQVQGRHRITFGKNNKYVTFWMRTRQLPEITKWIKEKQRDVLRDD